MGLIFFIAFCVLLAAAVLLAAWKGGWPERTVAALFLAAWLGSMLAEPYSAGRLHQLQLMTAVIDLLLLIGLGAVAHLSDRRWVILATGLQLIIVLAHCVKLIDPTITRLVYLALTTIWPIIQLLLLIGATLSLRRLATPDREPSLPN